jgi:prenyltransferase beta subunit
MKIASQLSFYVLKKQIQAPWADLVSGMKYAGRPKLPTVGSCYAFWPIGAHKLEDLLSVCNGLVFIKDELQINAETALPLPEGSE